MPFFSPMQCAPLPVRLFLRMVALFCITFASVTPGYAKVHGAHKNAAAQSGLRVANLSIDRSLFRVEIAETNAQREKGLMFRGELPENQGMLFIFRPAQRVSFWMKDTWIPLDIVFISNHRVSRIYRDVPPCRQAVCETYDSMGPVDMVVELSAGSANRHQIQPGASVDLKER